MKRSHLEGKGLYIVNHFYGASISKALQTIYPGECTYSYYQWFHKPIVTLLYIHSYVYKYFHRNHFIQQREETYLRCCLEVKWEMWRRWSAPRGFWDDKANRKEFFDWLAGEFGITQYYEWYRYTLS
jgi:hypothetical protein